MGMDMDIQMEWQRCAWIQPLRRDIWPSIHLPTPSACLLLITKMAHIVTLPIHLNGELFQAIYCATQDAVHPVHNVINSSVLALQSRMRSTWVNICQ